MGEEVWESGDGYIIVKISTDSFYVCSGTYQKCFTDSWCVIGRNS